MKDLDAAIADYNKGIEIAPDVNWFYEDRAKAFIMKGDDKAAIADYTKAIELEAEHADYYVQRANLLEKEGYLAGAISDMSKAIELKPKNGWQYYRRGNLRFRARSWTDSLFDFRKASELPSNDQDYIRFFIWILRSKLGEQDAATQEMKDYIKQRKPDPKTDWALKNATFLAGDLSEEDYFKAADTGDDKTKNEQKCEAWFYAGSKRLIAGEKDKAIEYFKNCVATGVTNFIEYGGAVSELKALGEQSPAK